MIEINTTLCPLVQFNSAADKIVYEVHEGRGSFLDSMTGAQFGCLPLLLITADTVHSVGFQVRDPLPSDDSD
jgi:hypothetical protein